MSGPGRRPTLGEAAGELAVGVERFRVAARGVAGAHQLGDELLAQRVLRDERGQLGGGLVGAAERGERRGARAAQPVADGMQAAGLDGRGVVGEREVLERRSPPQRERVARSGRAPRPAGCRPRPRRGRRTAGRRPTRARRRGGSRPARGRFLSGPIRARSFASRTCSERVTSPRASGSHAASISVSAGTGVPGATSSRARSARSLAPRGARPSTRTGPRMESCTGAR